MEDFAKKPKNNNIQSYNCNGFDKVPHKRLLSKRNYYDIEYNTLKWIECFLTSRTQTVINIIDGV